ncbi:MAG: SRPBCC family protein [Granulicella sp.]
MLKPHLAIAALLLTTAVHAQQPAAPPAPPANRPAPVPLQVPNPHYVSIPMTIEVNAPVDKVWARIGKYCDIGEWSGNSGTNTCSITSGTDGEFGAIRTVGNEVLVGKTRYSYTYAQAPRTSGIYNLYHGTLEAVSLSPATTRLNYTLFFDNSMLADDAVREADLTNRRTRFTHSLENMKVLAEGGTLPPTPPRPAPANPPAARPAPAPLMSPNPHYVSIPMTIEINAPVDKVWARVGKFCDIGEWGFPGCKITSGTDGEFGAVRSIGNEVLVGKTLYSYVYTQPLRVSGSYIMYHGTLEARALTPTTTQLNYTLLYDNSNLADDVAREADLTNRRTRFTPMLTNMKILSEGGTLPLGAVGGGRRPAPTSPVPTR